MEAQQRSQALRRWREHWPWGLAVLVGLGVVWRWGLAVLAVASGIAVVGGWIVWAVVMPGRLAPPLRGRALARLPDAKARLEAIDARTRLHHDLRNGALQLLTVLAVLVGAVVGFQQLAEDRDQARQQLAEDRDKALKDRELTRQGQASERFTRAINQLGSTRVETRIGGIYGLDQIAQQSSESTVPVGEVLLAWLNSRPRPRTPPNTLLREHAPDVQATLSVLTGQRYSSIVPDRLDLHGLGLVGAHLRSANLTNANLTNANLTNADLFGADLTIAHLFGADLTIAHLIGADLTNADLRGADLRGTNLGYADLGGADLTNADLRGTDLRAADLRGGADLRGADLRGADLRNARVDGDTRPTGRDWRQAGAVVVAP